jgi:glycosyltransferase involved in cell wall biosynthesis
MKIVEIFASQTWGGGEQYVFDFSRKLLKDNHVVWFAGKKSEVIERKLAAVKQPFYRLPLGWYFGFISIWKLAKLVRKESVDVIHVHHFKAAFVAAAVKTFMRRKPKVILTRHLVRKGKNNLLYRFLYRRIDKIIFVSHLAKQQFLSASPAILPEKIVVIFNSIYTEKGGNVLPKRTNSPLVVGFCGRLEKEKGVEVLLDAIPLCKNKNIKYLIA